MKSKLEKFENFEVSNSQTVSGGKLIGFNCRGVMYPPTHDANVNYCIPVYECAANN